MKTKNLGFTNDNTVFAILENGTILIGNADTNEVYEIAKIKKVNYKAKIEVETINQEVNIEILK